MSIVTTAILTTHHYEDFQDEEMLKIVNEAIEPLNVPDDDIRIGGSFELIQEAFGGFKVPQMPMFGGAFNCVDTKELLAALETINFEYPNGVRLVVEEENWTSPAVYTLKDKKFVMRIGYIMEDGLESLDD